MLSCKICKFANDESGSTAIEYALIASIISLAIIGGLTGIRTSLVGTFNSVVSGFDSTNP